jgi:hypothetical protein
MKKIPRTIIHGGPALTDFGIANHESGSPNPVGARLDNHGLIPIGSLSIWADAIVDLRFEALWP